ncbi:MAG: hypothetical protein ACKOBP_10325, partial [Planctomycetia bacterium]
MHRRRAVTLARDGNHSAPAGAYLAACVFHAVIHHESQEGLPASLTPALISPNPEGLPDAGTVAVPAADAKPHSGPYASPYRLSFRVPLKELLFDAAQPRGSVAAQSSVPRPGSSAMNTSIIMCPTGIRPTIGRG